MEPRSGNKRHTAATAETTGYWLAGHHGAVQSNHDPVTRINPSQRYMLQARLDMFSGRACNRRSLATRHKPRNGMQFETAAAGAAQQFEIFANRLIQITTHHQPRRTGVRLRRKFSYEIIE